MQSEKEETQKKKPKNGTLPAWLIAHAAFDGPDCLIWPFARMPRGYACAVTINGIKTYAHRHMCEIKNGPPTGPNMDTAHSCGNGHLGCVHPGHLKWASRKTNMADSIRHGTTQRGTKHVGHILTEDQVRMVRANIGTKSQSLIAKEFGVSQSTVSLIHLRKLWGWLE